ncbi:unnamed protein product [Gongylonema pulchrum]|uniref:Sugar kinase n=1 Tax=Gongylonema pulchrum TaxID=637853 RepID=A0A183EML3_9BILA|nr:unnamed protein product [Gongylonema pulchrum]
MPLCILAGVPGGDIRRSVVGSRVLGKWWAGERGEGSTWMWEVLVGKCPDTAQAARAGDRIEERNKLIYEAVYEANA